MSATTRTRRTPLQAIAMSLLMLAALFAQPAAALDADVLFGPVNPPQRIASSAGASAWFIEFRARGGSPVGHSFVVLGVRSASGRERIVRVAGFYASHGPVGAVASVAGVPGTVGYKKTDLKPALIRYRRMLGKASFARIERMIARAARSPGTFTMLANNCNAFVARIAQALGMQAPANTVQQGPAYLRALIARNRR
ncbi:MAG: hypothetical protein H6884_05190 [Rhodobiaceae bacterium]|nr:hypothetical protein [Rhodobiaceae bacterium]MCC0053433.1 hypothetical protein [Rhodobiaceae bacterium]